MVVTDSIWDSRSIPISRLESLAFTGALRDFNSRHHLRYKYPALLSDNLRNPHRVSGVYASLSCVPSVKKSSRRKTEILEVLSKMPEEGLIITV